MKNFSYFLFKFVLVGLVLIIKIFLFFPSVVLAINGPHRITDPLITGNNKGVCANCHSPHNGNGPKMWARVLPNPDEATFGGVHGLCYSCHDGSVAKTGLGCWDVFSRGMKEDHVMHDGAATKPGQYPMAFGLYLAGSLDEKFFPLDPDDWNTVPLLEKGSAHGRKEVNYKKGGKGFYCGSCHDPHNDPYGQPDETYLTKGSAYLRTRDGQVGTWSLEEETRFQNGRRKDFCNECHGNFHFIERDCLDCHHPHQGDKLISDNEILGRKIFRYAIESTTFISKPNIPKISDDPKDDSPSTLCYGCHGPEGGKKWAAVGATTIHGDDSATPREHHPMGTQAVIGNIPRALGCDASLMNKTGELTCTSCHNGFHWGNRDNNFLRWDFQQDSVFFCSICHTDKSAYNLGDEQRGHHQIGETSPVRRLVMVKDSETGKNSQQAVGCGNCMLCHFIHDGQNIDGSQRGEILTPDLDALMRVQPKNLAWSDKWEDGDLFDYEDMCFGCHGESGIVKGPGLTGSKLLPPKSLDPVELTIPGSIRFSHRFATPPMSETTLANIRAGGKFPISDGLAYGTLNDYGVSPGIIYCGTCHNVHDNRTNPQSPYLRGTRSPYVAMGFCEECHTTPMSTMFIDPMLNHPLGRGPAPTTSITWLPEFVTGLSGEKGGVTFTPAGEAPEIGRVICLSCHSVHAASTTFDGYADYPRSLNGAYVPGNHGNLLVMDNFLDPSGSDMCIRCHPDFSKIVNSPHDFSPGYRNGCQIGQKGTCSACHVPHNAASAITWNEKPILWARSLASEESCFQQVINPAYTLGDTILCYDCHSRCNDDPPLAGYGQFAPQDVAFVDGPGGNIIGYYEIAPIWLQDIPPKGFKTGGHYIKSPGGGIMMGDKLACSDCHDPHRGWTSLDHQNQAFIKEWLGGKRNEGFYASKNMAYDDPLHGPRNNTESRLICINCHGFSYDSSGKLPPTSIPFVAVNPAFGSMAQITPPTPTVFEHSSFGVFACTDCHQHNRITVFCIDCHAFPPTTMGNGWSGPGDTDENYPGGAGAHAVHIFNCKYDCLTCHVGCLHNAGGATVVNPIFDRSKISIDFNPLFGFPRLLGEYPTKMSYPGLPALYNPLQQVCFVGCHNPLAGDPDESPNLINPSPSWSLAIKNLPTPPTYPSMPLPAWMPDPREDLYYQQLLQAPVVLPQTNPLLVPWPLPAIP